MFWVTLNLTGAQRMLLFVADRESLCFVYIDKLCDLSQLGTATDFHCNTVHWERLLSDDRKLIGLMVE